MFPPVPRCPGTGRKREKKKKDARICGTAGLFHIVPSIHKTCPVASAGAKRKTVPSSEISEDSSNTSADRSITLSEIKVRGAKPPFSRLKLGDLIHLDSKRRFLPSFIHFFKTVMCSNAYFSSSIYLKPPSEGDY